MERRLLFEGRMRKRNSHHPSYSRAPSRMFLTNYVKHDRQLATNIDSYCHVLRRVLFSRGVIEYSIELFAQIFYKSKIQFHLEQFLPLRRLSNLDNEENYFSEYAFYAHKNPMLE